MRNAENGVEWGPGGSLFLFCLLAVASLSCFVNKALQTLAASSELHGKVPDIKADAGADA